MNILIPGTLFSSRAARVRRLELFKERMSNLPPRKITQGMAPWERAADGFERNDPDGTKLAELLAEAEK